MSIVSRLNKRFRQFGGFRLIWTYIRLGVFGEFLKQGFLVLVKKRQIDDAYYAIQGKVIPHIREQYSTLLQDLIGKYQNTGLKQEKSNNVWFCWLQGMDDAPEIVKVCYASLRKFLPEREIVIITNENIGQYVSFPEHIILKCRDGRIPMAQYSDLLRLELLTRYGGTWVDATVLCTGFNDDELPDYWDADLFFFQFLKKDDERFYGISNWFISASSNQKVLLILRDMLYQFWRDYECVVAYFIFHIFFTMIAEQFPEEVKKIPRQSNKLCFYLEHRLGDEYDEGWMKKLTDHCSLHKLNGRLWDEANGKENTFLCKIKGLYQ